jgi:hypothetical protein
MSSTALMDTSRLVGPVVGKLLSSPAAHNTPEGSGSNHFTGNSTMNASGMPINTSSSNNLHPPSTILEPGAFPSSSSGSKQAIVGNAIASASAGAQGMGLENHGNGSSRGGSTSRNSQRNARGRALRKIRSGKSAKLHSTHEPPDSPHSQTVSLSGGLESQASGPSRASLGSQLTKDTSQMPFSATIAGSDTLPFNRAAQGALRAKKLGVANGQALQQLAGRAASSQVHGDTSSSVRLDSPSSATRALHSIPVLQDSAAQNASLSILPHSQAMSERSGAGTE